MCDSGYSRCDAMYYYEAYAGSSPSNHDCGLCSNGRVRCRNCDGTGDVYVKTSIFDDLF